MSDEPRWGRICAVCALPLVLAYFVLASELAIVAFSDWQQYRQSLYGISSTVNPIVAVAHAAFMPWSNSPTGQTILSNGSATPYFYTPKMIADQRFPRAVEFALGPDVMKTVAFPSFVVILIPLAAALLPQTLRTARVQFHHLLRIAMYSAAIPLLSIPWLVHRFPTSNYFLNQESYWNEIALFMFAIVPAAMAIWWGFAFQRYLRLRHAWLTATLLAFIAWLIPMVCGYFWFVFQLRPGTLA